MDVGDETLEYFNADPARSRYFLVVLNEDRTTYGAVSLNLNGSETTEKAVLQFETALMVSAQALAAKDGYFPCGPYIDRKPRTEFEKASADFVRAINRGGDYTAQRKALLAAKAKEVKNGVR